MKEEEYKLIPMSEITDEAREIAVAWMQCDDKDWIGQKHKLASDIMNYAKKQVNQEVEKRIAERMPSEEWIASEARKRFTSNTGFFESAKYQGFIRCGKWLRSRLTCSEKPNNSQKTEGGEG